MQVGLGHDYLTQRGGAERVVLSMLNGFGTRELTTSFYDADGTYPEYRAIEVRTSPVNSVGWFRRDPRRALPILPALFKRLRLDDCDVALVSSSGWAHGMSTTAPKVVYCHNPPRWLYQPEHYFKDSELTRRSVSGPVRRHLLEWDAEAAASAAVYIANSSNVAARIRDAYRIEPQLLFPPNNLSPGAEEAPADVEPGFFLVIGRPRGYKNTEIVCQAIDSLKHERLVVVGGLPEHPEGRAWSPRIVGLTGVTDAQLRWLYRNASALVGAAHEDFGLTPVEAASFGVPTVALAAGGYLDTVVPGTTGRLVSELDPEAFRVALAAGIDDLDRNVIKSHAEKFSPQSFIQRLETILRKAADASGGTRA